MHCCVLLQNRILDHERLLIYLKEGTGRAVAVKIHVHEELEDCFVNHDIERHEVLPETIKDLCATKN